MRLRFAAGLLLGAALPAAAQTAPGWGLPQLMQSMAKVQAVHGNFAERKTIHLLNAPLLAAGTLTYRAPDYLRKTTTSPTLEDFTLDHGVATIVSGPDHATQQFTAATQPQISGLVEGIRATLAGDEPALEKLYIVQFSGTPQKWQLALQPKDPALHHFISWMIIQGQGNLLTAIDTTSPNGDHAEMGISETLGDAP